MQFKLIFVAAIAISLTACNGGSDKGSASSFEAKDINDAKLANLKGAWKCTSLQLAGITADEASGNALFNNVKGESIGTTMVIAADGNFYTAHPAMGSGGKWTFKSPATIKIEGTPNNEIEITSINGDTLSGKYLLYSSGAQKPTAKASATWVKLADEEGWSWANPALYGFSAKPTAKENDAQIAQRVKSLLLYDAQIAHKAFKEGAKNINTNLFRLPFQYYNGSIALKLQNPDDEFSALFFDADDAMKGYQALKSAYSKATFKTTGEFIEEYALFLKAVGNGVE